MAYGRSRKRYGNSDGGGFPLGQILAMSLGGGEANPAYGAQGPGDVDPGFKGDPEKAIGKFGTDKPFKPNNAFQKFYGMDDSDEANRELTMSRIKADDALKRMPKEIATRRAAEATADQDEMNRNDIRLASQLHNYARLESARTGKLVPTLSPDEFRFRYGTRGQAMGIPAAEAAALGAEGEIPGASKAAEAAQAATIAKNLLAATASGQELSVRQRFPNRFEQGILGEADAPHNANMAFKKQFDTLNTRIMGDTIIPDITDPSNRYQMLDSKVDPLTNTTIQQQPNEMVQFTPDGVIRRRKSAQPAPAATPGTPAQPAKPSQFTLDKVLPSTGMGPEAGYGPISDVIQRGADKLQRYILGLPQMKPSTNVPPASVLKPSFSPMQSQEVIGVDERGMPIYRQKQSP